MSRGRPKDGGGSLKTCGLGPARLRLRLNRAGRPSQENAETSKKPWGGGNLDSRCRGRLRLVRTRQSLVIGSQLATEFFGDQVLPGKEGRGEHGNYRHPQNDRTVEHLKLSMTFHRQDVGPPGQGRSGRVCPTEPVHGEIDWRGLVCPLPVVRSCLTQPKFCYRTPRSAARGVALVVPPERTTSRSPAPAAARLGASRPRALADLRAAPNVLQRLVERERAAARRTGMSGCTTRRVIRKPAPRRRRSTGDPDALENDEADAAPEPFFCGAHVTLGTDSTWSPSPACSGTCVRSHRPSRF